MRRITLWLVSTVAALVLLFSYRTSTMGVGGGSSAVAAATGDTAGSASGDGSGGTGDPGSTGSGTGSGTGSDDGTSGSSGSSGTSPGSSSGGAAKNGSFDGSVAQTRWGPVQVSITVSGGKITDVRALQVPDGNFRDQQINDYAVPALRQEALAAQSARIQAISGATVTSDGYVESLQAALDAAHRG
ncbi:FMN-binding protein [Plantactinospora siamensis]|uniref:FMN-binding protein n=1 Tax=Plantactinospora siamensis TaxID=555372 RepID=A0ABV6NZN3_9ACTN